MEANLSKHNQRMQLTAETLRVPSAVDAECYANNSEY